MTPFIDDRLSSLHLLKHPFYMDWMQGKLSRETLQDYACQYASHVDAFPRYISAIHADCNDAAARRILAENLADEEGVGYEASHPELWRRFAEGLGLTREQVLAAAPRAAILKVVETFTRLARRSTHEGLGALYAYESQVPEIAASKIEGLIANYGIDDARTLAFFEVHRTADVEHRRAVESILDALPERERDEARAAAHEAAQALWDFLSDVHAEGRRAA